MDEQATPPKPRRLRAALTIGAMVALSIAMLRFDFTNLGDYGYLSVFGLSLVGNATVILPAPTFVAAFAAGRTLDPWLVGLCSGLGAGIGESTGFLVGREGRAALGDRVASTRINAAIERYGALAVFVFAAIPNPLMDVAGIAAGMARMPYLRYLIACSAGKILRFTLLAHLGSGLG